MTLQLTFREPLAGLGSFTRYDLSPLAGAAGTYVLRAAEQPGVRLFLVDAAEYVPDFEPRLGDAAAPDARVLVVVTPRSDGMTANLLAPIVVDLTERTALQVIVADDLSRAQVPLSRNA
jgi:flagellar assembly factor FliW